MRISSPELHQEFIKGLVSQSTNVIDIGLVATEQAYLLAGSREDIEAVVVITASHNPKEYNGIKILKQGSELLTTDEILQLRALAEKDDGVIHQSEGSVASENIDNIYAEKMKSLIDMKTLQPMNVVLDAGSGMAGKIFPLILRDTPSIQATKLNFDLDGSFPSHEPNPEKDENIFDLREQLLKDKAAFGAAFDGDADRIVLIDERGDVLRGDVVTGILARYFVEQHAGGTIVHDFLSTTAIRDVIEGMGGRIVLSKNGHTHVKHKIREVDAIFGGEISGHVFLKDFYQVESSAYAFLLIAKILSDTGKQLSEVAKDFRTYAHWFGYVFPDKSIKDVMKKIHSIFEDEATVVERYDGVTCKFDEWWFNVRPSNTEPRVSIVIESKDQELTERKRDEILAYLGGTIKSSRFV